MHNSCDRNFRRQARRTAALTCAVALASCATLADATVESQTLNADTDWRADGVVTVPANVTVDLNGYTLWVSGLAGSGTFTSSVPDPATFDDLKALAKSENPYLFTWTVVDGNPVIPGADFVLDPATAAAGFKLKKDSTGLNLVYAKGFMVIVY